MALLQRLYGSLPEDIHERNSRREALLLLIAAAFVFGSALALSIAVAGGLTWEHLRGPLVWLLLMAAAHFLLARYRPGRDPLLLPLYALLTGWGLILVDRLTLNLPPVNILWLEASLADRQTLWLVVSVAALLAVALLPRNLGLLRRYRYVWLISGLLLLALTLIFGVNPEGGGEALWLPLVPRTLGGVYFQPSELLKLLLVVFLASYFADRQPLIRLGGQRGLLGALPYLAPLLLMWGFAMILLVWQRDLGAATLFLVIFVALLYLATGEWRYAVAGIVMVLAAGAFAYFVIDKVTLRVDIWWNPWLDVSGRAYQVVQSLYAVAAGGTLGQGVAQGYPYFVPVVHSDFVFAAIAEEWGLVGSLAVVACFMLLAHRGVRAALSGRSPFRLYLVAGITVLFSAQALLIMGGITKLIPLTGVTLPFMSYGGSSLLISSVMFGLLLYVSEDEAGEAW